MRIAVLGLGLIGGSIGLAARRRLGAEVTGFDPDADTLRKGVELGAVGDVAPSLAEACSDAQIVFCAAPVGVLPELVADALDASRDAAVSDVGSTKAWVKGMAAAPAGRFIGGHPLAGAETSGVENAREDLFEGARWYLTPTEHSSGMLYDRLQRAVADLGARPQAIDAETHDRLMASVSHLPHVLANVLVSQAAAAASEEAERLPEIGPSFRDSARVAGANPAVWTGIFDSNSDAVAGEIEAVIGRLEGVLDLLRRNDSAALEAWHRTAGDDRRRLLEADLVGGPLFELRVRVENRPGTVAEIALALGRARVNIEDMALHPAPDMRSGAISVWVAGDEEAERAAEVVRELGHSVTIMGGA